jgi:hypothetical protein
MRSTNLLLLLLACNRDDHLVYSDTDGDGLGDAP